ncbi:DNA-directed DNA polymerase [Coemansia javaensis]|uniref:DNA-directed DNA polymerase n=1 Tax=Coemansia javaensis TaxID=2761396 RepID=A0A9W8HLF7_9FUNG|nr:DNA-directed DNA polymerase [Coemansia javaensis]
MPTTLDFYWDLASLDAGKRASAAAQLITALVKFQGEMPATDELAATDADLDRLCAGDVAYGVRRLIKGLGSGRDGARQGYAVALAELLGRVRCISARVVLDLLWSSTEATRSMKGQEQRDVWFGRVFGMMAVVQSGLLGRAGAATAVDLRKMAMELAAIGGKKSYLREVAYAVLGAMVPVLGRLSGADMGELVAMFVDVALDKGAIETPDELLLALRLRRAYPGYDWAAALPQWHGAHMLSAKNAARVVPILCEVSADNTALFSSWHPQLHSVWDEVLDLYFNKRRAFEVESLRPMEFSALWDRVVENGLFAGTASQFRRYWGFLVLERLLPHLSEENVPAMMTPNIVRTLSDNVSLTGKSHLAKAGLRVAERLIEVCEGNTKVGLAVLTHLLNQKSTIQAPGAGKTSLRTMMATRIVAKLDSAAIVGYVEYLQRVFLTPRRARTKSGVADPSSAINVSDKSLERQRAWAVDQMIRVARFAQLPISDELTAGVVRFVVAQAAFRIHGDAPSAAVAAGAVGAAELAVVPVPPLSGTTREYCATAVIGLVGDLNRHTPADGEEKAETAEAEAKADASNSSSSSGGKLATGRARDGTAWATATLGAVLDLAAARGVQEVRRDLGEVRRDLGAALKVLREMGGEAARLAAGGSTVEAQRVHVLELLLGTVCVMAALAPGAQARAEHLEAVPELTECYRRLQAAAAANKGPGRTPKSRKARAGAGDDVISGGDDEPQPVEVLTDMLLGFLARESSVLRRLCEQVFAPFAGLLTARAMESITGVLLTREGDADGAVEADAEMDVDVDVDVDGENAEEAMDVEMADEAVDEELRRKIQEALGDGGAAMDEASDEGDEEEYDDEQMTVFDDKLAEIFRHKREQKTAARDLKITLTNFKLRVLDLAEAFLARQGESALVVPLVAALVDLARATRRDSRAKPLHDRAMAMLGARRPRVPRGFDHAQAARLLATVHERARRAADRAEVRVLGAVAAFVARALLDDAAPGPARAEAAAAVRDANAASMRDFMTHKASQIYVDFFRPVVERLAGWQLAPLWRVAVAAAADFGRPRCAVNVYRQVQAFALVDAITASASRLAADSGDSDDPAPFAELAPELAAALRTALVETIAFAASNKNRAEGSNTTTTTTTTTTRLAVDAQRLREIIRHWLIVVRRCVRSPLLQPAFAAALQPAADWDAALQALQASPRFATSAIKKHCETLGDLPRLIAA